MPGEEELSRQLDPQQSVDPGSRRLAEQIEEHRISSARLLDSFAHRLGITAARGTRGAGGAVRNAACNMQRAAHYVQANYVRSMSTGVERFIRRQPVPSIMAAVLAGFFIGRALRSR